MINLIIKVRSEFLVKFFNAPIGTELDRSERNPVGAFQLLKSICYKHNLKNQ